ncbi:hypothetical protein ACFV2X_38290 [Streptomyces sp. NPDC059679]|uniref:DUF6197 family protein n=1 Tax=Streptomyces sp. NPDC059679 TaxID=3346903 RepID=UPI00367531F2
MTAPTSDPEATASVLYQAADYIETHGWHQGSLRNQYGAVCAMGAIATIAPVDANRQTSAAERAALAALARYLDLNAEPGDTSPVAANPGLLVSAWNDDAENADQVITAMRHTAKHLTGGS